MTAEPPAVARKGLVAAVVLLLIAVLGALVVRLTPLGELAGWPPVCTVVTGERDVRPPSEVTEAAARAHDELDGAVSSVTTVCSLADVAEPVAPDGPDPADDPAQWVVAVDAQAGDVDAVAVAAAAVLAAASPAAPFSWRLDVHDAARSLAVVLTPGGDTDLVEDAVALRRTPGVAEVWFGPDSGRVAVATGADVAPVLAATAGRDLPVTTVESRDDWLEVQQIHPGTWPDADSVALAADVAGWEGVWRVVLSGGEPASPDLTVEADDDAHRAHVASRLAATVHRGPAVPFHVLAQQVALDGVVGGVAAEPDRASATPGLEGVPACTGDELRVEVAGTDAALGTRYLMLRATHTGTAPCVLVGMPELAFTRQSGTRTPDLTQLPESVTPPASGVLLQPGAAAGSQVRWRAMSTTQDPDLAVGVTVRAVEGGPAVELVLPDPLDVLAGATLKVGQWSTSEAG
ncbi:DUF4232 domain-containing protein [Cellulomonas fengjieae]|uniref:DUF4232 domain-containing protein n=1 Tax=Cellulomonas fengjieae TaxID=2819978 RepID=A0ABS3SEF7_9CELL|nr:DUF4232 domain-containing protein [Cellulomonas fengjieae]MBO3083345.1 DUF4232 domain-containing protein [Cellulomonas fengjieae]QVI65311.1 DUF4232 domain-containing protein [Cellulomonas fengjieae]